MTQTEASNCLINKGDIQSTRKKSTRAETYRQGDHSENHNLILHPSRGCTQHHPHSSLSSSSHPARQMGLHLMAGEGVSERDEVVWQVLSTWPRGCGNGGGEGGGSVRMASSPHTPHRSWASPSCWIWHPWFICSLFPSHQRHNFHFIKFILAAGRM